MRLAMALTVVLLTVAGAGSAQAQALIAAIRADNWNQAEALALAEPDPLARKLVRFYRLLAPGPLVPGLSGAGTGRAAEIASFMAENPDWPQQALLSRRLQEALAAEKDDRAVLEICRNRPQTTIPSLLRCADAEDKAGVQPPEHPARRAWLTGITDPAGEAAFMRRWGGVITPEDQWRRFDRLAWSDSAAPAGPAARQAIRLAAAQRPMAEARLALRRDIATAPALVGALPEAARSEPALVLELARWYRRAGQDQDAARIWTTLGAAAEAGAPAERRAAFWDERNLLARRLLRFSEPAAAFAVAAIPADAGEPALDSAFLAGWIALRRLGRPAEALPFFTRLATLSPAAITQGRAHYWLARTQAALNDPAAAQAEYQQAARWPTTYYGQLAARALGEPSQVALEAAADPAWDATRALAFLNQDGARAAVILAAWGDARRAKPFIQRLDELARDNTERALAAQLALGLGLPEQSVAIARRAGRDGLMLAGAGWPAAVTPPSGGVEQAVLLGLIRQESSFDVQAQSSVGARGLMQLMPATAAGVARKLGLPASLPALTSDADYNMRLGSAYLQDLLVRFDSALPLAIAGYNAGPGRVVDWLAANPTAPVDVGDPAEDMIDWIEQIPFNETRNYVQRVIENIVIYRAQLGAQGPHPVAMRKG